MVSPRYERSLIEILLKQFIEIFLKQFIEIPLKYKAYVER